MDHEVAISDHRLVITDWTGPTGEGGHRCEVGWGWKWPVRIPDGKCSAEGWQERAENHWWAW
eukprot:13507230-Alexandrium_andersonii.AAC.1